MCKQYKYKCTKCATIYEGDENSVCPNCGHDKKVKIMFWKLIKALKGEWD